MWHCPEKNLSIASDTLDMRINVEIRVPDIYGVWMSTTVDDRFNLHLSPVSSLQLSLSFSQVGATSLSLIWLILN